MVGKAKNKSKEFEGVSTEKAIQIAAEAMCSEQGASQVKLRQVAKRVGIEPGAMYNHFKGLDNILSTIVRGALSDLLNQFKQAEHLATDQAVKSLCLHQVELFTRRKGITRLLLVDMAEVNGHIALSSNEDLIAELNAIEHGIYTRHCDSALSQGELHDIILARWGMILSMISFRWLAGVEIDEDEAQVIAERVHQFVLGFFASKK